MKVGCEMFEYKYGIELSDEKLIYYKDLLVNKFAKDYDIKTNRLWNCLKLKSFCWEFEDARKLDIPNSKNILFYLERQNEVYRTTFDDICKYIDELEPWEDIDAYIFDETFKWLFAITHEDLKCVIVGLINN
jgi:hypothetical protein